MGKLSAIFKVSRIVQIIFLIAIIGMTAHLVSEAQKAGETSSESWNLSVAALSVSCLAAFFCALTLFLYMDNYVPLHVITVLELCFLIAFVVVATLWGDGGLAYINCKTTGSRKSCYELKGIWALFISESILFFTTTVSLLWSRELPVGTQSLA